MNRNVLDQNGRGGYGGGNLDPDAGGVLASPVIQGAPQKVSPQVAGTPFNQGSSINSATQSNPLIPPNYWSGASFRNNAAFTLPLMGQGQVTHDSDMWEVVLAGASPAADIVISWTSGSEVLWYEVIGANAPVGTRVGAVLGDRPLRGKEGQDLTLNIPAGGAGVILYASAKGWSHHK